MQLAMIVRGNRQELLVSNFRNDFQMLLLFHDFICLRFKFEIRIGRLYLDINSGETYHFVIEIVFSFIK